MTDYTKNASFTAKTGQTIQGADFDSEFDEIATAIASKENTVNKGANSGYCGLDSAGLVAAADLPAATATAQGAVELATDAEAITGTDTVRAITPANLAAAMAGGASGLTKAYKAVTTSRSSTTTPTADPELSLAVVANAVYRFEAFARGYSTSANPDLKTIFTGPAGSAYRVVYGGGHSGFRMEGNVSEVSEISQSLGASTEGDIHYVGTLITAGTAGTFTLDWAQVTSDATATQMLSGSWLTLTRIA